MAEYLNVREFHASRSSYLDQVERGATLVLTRRGRPVAMVVPFSEERMARENAVDWGA